MRYILVLLVFVLLLLTAHSLLLTPIFADSKLALDNYTKQYDLYRQNYQSYVTSKNKWLTYKTLTSQTEALMNGRTFLKQRVKVVTSYLLMLKERVNESGGFNDAERNLIFGKINVELAWLNEHLDKYDSAATLSDLEQLSDRFADRFSSVIQFVALQTSGQILFNKEKIFNTLLDDIVNRLDQTLPAIRGSGQNTAMAERWLLNTKNKNDNAKQKQDEVLNLLANFQGENILSQYNSALFTLTESNQYLKEATSYLKEVVKNIKGE